MDALLTRSFTHSSTRPVNPILVYAQSPYDVEIARHEHLADYVSTMTLTTPPPRLASFTLACPPTVRLCIRANLALSVVPPLDFRCGLQSSVRGLQISSIARRKPVDTIRLRRSE